MDLKKLFRIYEDDPKKYGLYELSLRFYNGNEDGISASIFLYVHLGHSYDNDPDGVRHCDFMELLFALQDCVGFHFISGSIAPDGIDIKGWL